MNHTPHLFLHRWSVNISYIHLFRQEHGVNIIFYIFSLHTPIEHCIKYLNFENISFFEYLTDLVCNKFMQPTLEDRFIYLKTLNSSSVKLNQHARDRQLEINFSIGSNLCRNKPRQNTVKICLIFPIVLLCFASV